MISPVFPLIFAPFGASSPKANFIPVGCGFASGFGVAVLFSSKNFGAATVAGVPTVPSTSSYFGSYLSFS